MLGNFLLSQGRLDEAQAFAQDILITRPGSPDSHVLLTAIAIVQEDWKRAADELEKALTIAGDDYPNIDYAFVTKVFAQAGRPNDAKRYARKGGLRLTLESTAPLSGNGSGITLPPPAVGVPQGMIQNPGDEEINAGAAMVNPAADALEYHNKALAFAEAGKNAEAREHFLISLKLNPSAAQTWNNIGTLSFLEGKFTEAKEQYERALEQQKDYADAHSNLGLLLLTTGDTEAAKPHIAEAKRLGKNTAALEVKLK